MWLALTAMPVSAVASQVRFEFVDADLRVVVDAVARITGMTFVFDPTRVKGKITVLAPRALTPAETLDLLRSVLALHGYAVVVRPESTWVLPATEVAHPDFVVRVVPLTYANAGEVAWTLSRVAPPGVRVVPYPPTNSVVISGLARAVDQMVDVIQKP